MKTVLMFLVATGAVTVFAASRMMPMAAEHVREMKKRPDGKFDVTCIDGETEVRTQEQVSAGALCTHITQDRQTWQLHDGGVHDGTRFCDLNVQRLISRDRILRLEAQFLPPCAGEATQTEECNGKSCSLRLGETYYSFEFTPNDALVVTRLSDGFAGTFASETTVFPAANKTRLQDVRGKENILQVSENGRDWYPVCDDQFGQEDAEVACRSMGYRGVDHFQVAVLISGDRDYGLDDLRCDGSERSLFDCRGNAFRDHDCQDGEHVQLYCRR